MKNQFCGYEIALALKELGFNEACLGAYYPEPDSELVPCKWYDNNNHRLVPKIAAPLWQQAIDWIRNSYNIVVNVYANASGYLFEMHDSAKKGGTHRYDSGFDGPSEGGCWDKYYDAREAAILKAIEICQKNLKYGRGILGKSRFGLTQKMDMNGTWKNH